MLSTHITKLLWRDIQILSKQSRNTQNERFDHCTDAIITMLHQLTQSGADCIIHILKHLVSKTHKFNTAKYARKRIINKLIRKCGNNTNNITKTEKVCK